MRVCVARVTDGDRKICESTFDGLKESSQRARRTRILA